MYNEEILKTLEENFGKRECVIFCRMEAMKNLMIANDMRKNGANEELLDAEFDAYWWSNKEKELRKHLIG